MDAGATSSDWKRVDHIDGVIPWTPVLHCMQYIENSLSSSSNIWQQVPINRKDINEAATWVLENTFVNILNSAITNATCLLPGLQAAATLPCNLFGLYSSILESSSTVFDYLQNTVLFQSLISDNYNVALTRKEGFVLWNFNYNISHLTVKRHVTDFVLAHWILHLRKLTRESELAPYSVLFKHSVRSNGAHEEKYQKIFRCPVHFYQKYSCLVMPYELLDLKLKYHDPILLNALILHAQSVVSRKKIANSLTARTEECIRTLISSPSLSREFVAKKLGVSVRQLHRKLESEGTSYSDILDNTRMNIAKTLLTNSGKNLSQIAAHVGFNDGRTFVRWFKNLNGVTPGAYRSKRPTNYI